MKKKKIIITIIVLSFILLLSIFIINKYRQKILSEEKVLIEYSYSSYAWGFEYFGIIVCKSGNIYKFKYKSSEDVPKSNSKLENISNNLLKNVTKYNGKIKSSDLKLIKEYSKMITEDYETNNQKIVFDGGIYIIKLYDYDDNKTITLKETGEIYIQNNGNYVNEILDILEKYNISIINYNF